MQGCMCLVGLLVEDGWLKTHQVLQVTQSVLFHLFLLTGSLSTIWSAYDIKLSLCFYIVYNLTFKWFLILKYWGNHSCFSPFFWCPD